jgi:hypothetical protein
MKEKTGDDASPEPAEMVTVEKEGVVEDEVEERSMKGLKGKARCCRSHCCKIHVNDE